MSTKTGLRVGILGAGAMGEQHLDSWHKLGAQIAGVYARNLERGRAAAEPYGCPVYDSVDELLSKVEIADICLPTTLHQTTVRQAAQAGCQIVCEKPLALRLRRGRSDLRDCDTAKVRIFLAMVVRFFPVYRAVWKGYAAAPWDRLKADCAQAGCFPSAAKRLLVSRRSSLRRSALRSSDS